MTSVRLAMLACLSLTNSVRIAEPNVDQTEYRRPLLVLVVRTESERGRGDLVGA